MGVVELLCVSLTDEVLISMSHDNLLTNQMGLSKWNEHIMKLCEIMNIFQVYVFSSINDW